MEVHRLHIFQMKLIEEIIFSPTNHIEKALKPEGIIASM